MRRSIAAILVSIALVSCSSDGTGPPPNDALPTSDASATPPVAGSPLKEGRLKDIAYATQAFQPAFTFTPPEKGWVSYAANLERFLLFALPPEDYLIFLRPLHVFDPGAKPALVRVPDDLVTWLENHPDLEAQPPQTASVGGLEGRYVDVTVSEAPRFHGEACAKEECVTLTPSYGAGPAFHLLAGEKARFYVLGSGEEQILVVIEAAPEDFDGFEEEASKFLDTVSFG